MSEGHAECDALKTKSKSTIYRVTQKKMSLSVFELKSVLDVGFDFSACVLESELRARFN